jgi:2'-5' RNA ligase
MKRLFTALKIHPGDEFLKSYRELKQDLGHERIKWVEENNIHITLKFFGETAEQKIPGICSVLKNRAGVTSSFDLQLTGLGIFGSSYAPKVVWVGIAPYAELVNLMKYIHDDLKIVGFEPDRQNLVPHLTLGRIKLLQDKVLFNRTISGYKTLSSSPLHISEMTLYESILHREGPQYIVIEKFPFL